MVVLVDVVVFYIYFIKIERNVGLCYVIVYVNVIINFGNRYNKYFGVLIILEVDKYVLFCILLLFYIYIF